MVIVPLTRNGYGDSVKEDINNDDNTIPVSAAVDLCSVHVARRHRI